MFTAALIRFLFYPNHTTLCVITLFMCEHRMLFR